jgi:O-antigen ligase
VLCLVLVAVYRPWSHTPESRVLDAWIAATIAAVAFQCIPLPASIVDRVSPSARGVWQALSLGPVSGAQPLSVDLSSTAWALAVCAGSVAAFFVARQVFASGGVRIVARGIASVGLVLSALCLAQDATAHGAMYWRWRPEFAVAPPFGPFVNRNHFATWAVLALPPAFGYLLAHGSAHARAAERVHWRQVLADLVDARSIWLVAAICLMLVALVASQSRSGMVGLVAALALAMYLRGRHGNVPPSGWALAALGLAALAAIVRIDPVDLYHRFGTAGAAAADRVSIWRATLPVVQDFWLTGTGAGTFETVMLVYQRSPSLFRINAAHNQFLQILAEGGVLLTIPVAGVLVAFAREARRALERDRSGMYLLRVGALSGLAGAAVQSVWETGLSTPANAVLAAVLGAIVIHRSTHTVRSVD